jgi:hypothetical protein
MKNFQNKAKIIKVSTIIRHVLFAGVVVWAIGILVILFKAISLGFGAAVPAQHCLSWGMVGLMGLRFFVNLKLFRFFDRLKNGHFFDAQTVGQLDAAGKWWIVLWLYDVLFHEVRLGVFQIVDDWNPTSFDLLNFGSLFAGLVLVFVAWLLKEAQELQEEQELTV